MRRVSKFPLGFVKELLGAYVIKDAGYIKSMIQDLVGETLQGILDSELNEHLVLVKAP